MIGLANFLVESSKLNKSEQLQAETQANARNCVLLIVQRLRSAGWNPRDEPTIGVVGLDSDPTDAVSVIDVFADLDESGSLDALDESVTIRHFGDRVEWRRDPTWGFEVIAHNISNDADGDGVLEPMFIPDSTTDPTLIIVQVTATSAEPDPKTGELIRYTVTSEVALREAL